MNNTLVKSVMRIEGFIKIAAYSNIVAMFATIQKYFFTDSQLVK